MRFSLLFSQFSQSPSGYLWETPPGDGGSAPAPATSGSSGSAAPAPAAAAPQTATPPATTPASATPSTQAGQPPREGWVPSYRIRETREAAIREQQEQFATREQELRAEYERLQQQVRSLVGVQAPPDQETATVKNQFSKLYPGLARLEERAEALLGVIDKAGNWDDATDFQWQSYGKNTVDRLFGYAEKDLGSPLTDEGKRQLHSAFVGFVQSSPEMTNRYRTDPELVTEWWKAFSSSFIEPARRIASSGAAQRAAGTPLPQDRGGVVPPVTPGPQLKNLDERADAAWALYQQNARK
jgi:hypothetical protein